MADPLLIGGAAIAALALTSEKSKSPEELAAEEAERKALAAPIQSAHEKELVAGIGAVPGKLAAIGAATAANPYAGAVMAAGEVMQAQAALYTSMLGGSHGAYIALAGPVYSAPIAGGALVGRELDKLLGGTGNGESGLLRQAAWGGVGLAVLCSTGIGAVVAAAYAALASTLFGAIDDEVKRAQTHSGARVREFEQRRSTLLEKTIHGFMQLDPSAGPNLCARIATPFVDGYSLQMDRLGYLQAMDMAWGIGVDKATHAFHQRTRGYFIGDTDAAGNYDPRNIPLRSRSNEHMNSFGIVPWEEKGPDGKLRNPRVEYKYRRILPVHKPVWEMLRRDASNLKQYLAARDMETAPGFSEEIWGAYDAFAEPFFQAGKLIANATAYADWMKQPWGLGQSENSHGFYGRNDGMFEGTLLSGRFRWKSARGSSVVLVSGTSGMLEWEGRRFYWRAEDGHHGIYTCGEDVTHLAGA